MKMKFAEKTASTLHQVLIIVGMFIALFIVFLLSGCNDNNDPGPVDDLPDLTGKSITYTLESSSDSGVNGTVVFAETEANTTLVTFTINGGTTGDVHPVHIHQNSKAVGGGIEISLGEIDGSTGKLIAEVSVKDDDSGITYDDLINYDGHINIHASPSDLSTIVAYVDIGKNEITGQIEDYDLFGKNDPDLKGEVHIQERKSGEVLITVMIEGNAGPEDHPVHIHADNAVDGGSIVISLNAIDASTGMSKTHVSETDNGTEISFNELKEFDGHVNVHKSETELQTVILQGDIGQNKLTSELKEYDLMAKTNDNISGKAWFTKRRNNETLITISLNNTPDGGSHPAHIHNNTAAEGGGIAIDLTNVDGSSGKSLTNVSQLNDGTSITFDELTEIDGYINVHLSQDQLQSIVAQGDVGQNVLTGNAETYNVSSINGSNISGTVTFYERLNETTLIEISLTGTSDPDSHPTHIHENDVNIGGGILIGLNPVNGATGKSMTQVAFMDNDTPISYDELITINGHLNVHWSSNDLSVVASGNVGDNAN